jgi:hypothetical protein
MTRRFPKSVHLTIGRRQQLPIAEQPFLWEVRVRADQALGFIAEGTAPSRAEAREQAWLALEQVGLVVDE